MEAGSEVFDMSLVFACFDLERFTKRREQAEAAARADDMRRDAVLVQVLIAARVSLRHAYSEATSCGIPAGGSRSAWI